MRLIDIDAFWDYVRSHKTNFGKYQHDLLNKQPTVQAIPIEELQEIRQEILNRTPTVVTDGDFDEGMIHFSGEVIEIIDKHIKEIEGGDKE